MPSREAGSDQCNEAGRRAARHSPACSLRRRSAAADARLQLGLEGIDIALSMILVGTMISLLAGTPDLSPSRYFGHQLHALVAPFIGLLHDGAGDGAFAARRRA